MNQDKKRLTGATYITFARIASTPVLAWALATHTWAVSLIILIGAMISDVLDGFVARRFNHQTNFGALLDTLADKLITITLATTTLLTTQPLVPAWLAWLLLAKEIIIFVGAAYLWLSRIIPAITPLIIGKISMSLQMGVFVWALAQRAYGVFFWQPVIITVAFVLVISLISYTHMFISLTCKTNL